MGNFGPCKALMNHVRVIASQLNPLVCFYAQDDVVVVEEEDEDDLGDEGEGEDEEEEEDDDDEDEEEEEVVVEEGEEEELAEGEEGETPVVYELEEEDEDGDEEAEQGVRHRGTVVDRVNFEEEGRGGEIKVTSILSLGEEGRGSCGKKAHGVFIWGKICLHIMLVSIGNAYTSGTD